MTTSGHRRSSFGLSPVRVTDAEQRRARCAEDIFRFEADRASALEFFDVTGSSLYRTGPPDSRAPPVLRTIGS